MSTAELVQCESVLSTRTGSLEKMFLEDPSLLDE